MLLGCALSFRSETPFVCVCVCVCGAGGEGGVGVPNSRAENLGNKEPMNSYKEKEAAGAICLKEDEDF